ncbi:hypothetical protein [Sphingomonas sp. IW22]|uniref:hypothetical protein n=1 Tax=Sphingomonas sp. IW22 TaxID=3242489 RepID=UPI00351FD8D9
MATRPDLVAQNALAADIRRPVDFAFLDIGDEPLRVTTAPSHVSISGTGDEDLDGFTFQALDPMFVSVGRIRSKEGGGDTVTLTLSGLAGVDAALMTDLGNKANYAGRDARLWKAMLHPDTLGQIGAIWCYYTGYMSVPRIVGDRSSQVITLDVESYLGFFSQASNRTYQDQQVYDPGDRSAELAVAIANGAGNPR